MTLSEARSEEAIAGMENTTDSAGSGEKRETFRLRDIALAAIADSLGPALDQNGDAVPFELRWLQSRKNAVGSNWTVPLRRAFDRPHPHDEGLIFLARQLRLSAFEVLAIALAAAVEEEPLGGRVLAFVQSPLGGSRPTLGLLAQAFGRLVAAGIGQWRW